MLPKQNVRRVIGPQGSKIKMMRETTGAKIDIDSDCVPGSDSQLCRIRGTEEQCNLAKNLINSALNGDIPAIPGATFAPSFAGPSVVGPNASPYGPGTGQACLDPGQAWPRPGLATRPGLGSSSVHLPGGPTTLCFGPEVVTRIIGAGGSMIKLIRQRSGCRINVDPHERIGDQQPIRFAGTDPQIRLAIEMVNKVVDQDASASDALHSEARTHTRARACTHAPIRAPSHTCMHTRRHPTTRRSSAPRTRCEASSDRRARPSSRSARRRACASTSTTTACRGRTRRSSSSGSRAITI